MRSFTFTLLSDGASDRALIPALEWLLREHLVSDFQSQWADLRWRHPPLRGLADRIEAALTLYPCDLLFIHRDGEGEPRERRVREIRESLPGSSAVTAVCVVPVRMQEAWLLFDEAAIRRAADNPQGRMPLKIPALERLEELPDPKKVLWSLLAEASGLRPGRLRRFSPAPRIHRVAELIRDFSPLRRLPAFQLLEDDLKTVLAERDGL
ncbi:MAG TPA: hypothetical protein VLQ45_09405 [Thermoanaerobaculia bacterium]|nr:hypothetical protein [Thermoanaerobaculia bacterium]